MSISSKITGGVGVVVLAGTALTVMPSGQATAAGGVRVVRVSCSTPALITAINTANGLGIAKLLLAPGCTYNITTPVTATDGLPTITANITLAGGPSTTIRRDPAAATAFRVLNVAAGGTLGVQGISILNGSSTGLGGGIQNAGTAVLYQTTLSGNRAGNGGAFANLAGAKATISHTLINANNTTSVGGGGIINSGTLTMDQSVLSGNSAPINGGALNTQPGGVSRLIQSTFTRNISGGLGGAMSNLGTTSLVRTLVQLNKGSGGGGIATGNTNVTLQNSSVRNNTPDNCSPSNTIPGCVG